ncbi:MAG: DUF3822 family protein [Flavobacteriales bacterium]
MTPYVPEIAARAKISKELLGQASMLHCCMHLNSDRVEISLADATTGQISWAEAFDIEPRVSGSWEEVLNFIAERNWFEKVFRKCTLTFDTGEYTVVPTAFFEQGREAQLLQFHTGKEYLQAEVLSLTEYGAQFVFDIPQGIRALSGHFPNIRIFPAAWIMARYAWMQAPATGSNIFIWQTGNRMDLLFLQDRKLLLCRNDLVQSAEDILYHAANAAMRLGVDFENTPLFLYSLKDDSTTRNVFASYCKELKPVHEGAVSIITKMQISCV